MNRPKPACAKKTLVRNPEQPIPKTVTIKPPKNCIPSKSDAKPGQSTGILNTGRKTTNFNVPEMHSTLKLSKKIDKIVNPSKTEIIPKVDHTKLAIDEKVSRKVNFPYGQSVFKDLIPLTDNELKVQPVALTKGPAYQKDKEPILSDFFQARKQQVYYHNPRNSIKYLEENKPHVFPTNSSLRLYRVLKINEESM